jgi:hypothetical protein
MKCEGQARRHTRQDTSTTIVTIIQADYDPVHPRVARCRERRQAVTQQSRLILRRNSHDSPQIPQPTHPVTRTAQRNADKMRGFRPNRRHPATQPRRSPIAQRGIAAPGS